MTIDWRLIASLSIGTIYAILSQSLTDGAAYAYPNEPINVNIGAGGGVSIADGMMEQHLKAVMDRSVKQHIAPEKVATEKAPAQVVGFISRFHVREAQRNLAKSCEIL